jgi:hypothetical protein
VITDTLRPPPLLDPTAAAYKDWLHLNVFDHESGCIGIFNASLHGSPSDPRSRALGAALVHVPDVGWVGNIEIAALEDASIGTNSIALERVALGTDPFAGSVLASARLLADGLEAGITATAAARPIEFEQRLPFGSGWMSWYVVPRLTVQGGLLSGERRLDLSHATAYHDHNWGRWFWGDDVGWEWGACVATDPAITLVVSRATDRAHRATTGTTLVCDAGGERRSFGSAAVRIGYEGRLQHPLRRVPGALAALHQDRIAPWLPALIHVRADDGVDRIELEFVPRAAAQLIAGDPARRGYGFIHQMAGAFDATLRLGGRSLHAQGLAVFEYVD